MVDTFRPRLQITIRVRARHLSHIEKQLTAELGIIAAIAEVEQGIRENFERERAGDRPWKDLTRRTELERRRKRLPTRPILYRGKGPTGPGADRRVLRDAMTSEEAVVRRGQSLFATHPVPDDPRYRGLARTRPMVVMSRERVDAIRQAVQDHYFGIVRGINVSAVVTQPRD